MFFGAIIQFFITLYGGENPVQKNPLGFMAFLVGNILLPIGLIIFILIR